tara:strand:+ start:7365 stop:7589 length:225 start_codon:yes stop_codon:yes gene_type:complete
MKAKELKDLNKNVRVMIETFIKDNGMSLARFSDEAGVHQSQMWMYMNSGDPKKGLHSSTLEKIGIYLSAKSYKK